MKLLVHVDFSMQKRFEHFNLYVDTKSQVHVELYMLTLSRVGREDVVNSSIYLTRMYTTNVFLCAQMDG